MGAAQDPLSEGLRRMIVNAGYWALGMESRIPEKSNVDLVGDYHPSPFGFGGHRKDAKPQTRLWPFCGADPWAAPRADPLVRVPVRASATDALRA